MLIITIIQPAAERDEEEEEGRKQKFHERKAAVTLSSISHAIYKEYTAMIHRTIGSPTMLYGRKNF